MTEITKNEGQTKNVQQEKLIKLLPFQENFSNRIFKMQLKMVYRNTNSVVESWL